MTAATKKLIFSHLEDEQLVECVRTFPCLYDLTNSEFKNLEAKDNAWREIGEYVQRSVEDCKKRWRNIKDTHHKRRKKEKRTGSSASSKPKQWQLAPMLSFLGKVDSKRQRITSNIPSDDASTQDDREHVAETDEDTSSTDEHTDKATECTSRNSVSIRELCRPATHNKRQRREEPIFHVLGDRGNERGEITSQNHDDHIDLFFKSIAMSVKQLRPELVNEAKMRTLQMLIDLETHNAMEFKSLN